MLDARDPAHYLKALVSDNVPQRLLWLDCASESERDRGTWIERWSSGALGTTHWTSRKGERRDTLEHYNSPNDLWFHANRFCLPRRRTVLFAYDLALQIRISQALIKLPMFDWHLDKIVLERSAAWALFRDCDRTLLMCDLKSWAPVALEDIKRDCMVNAQDDNFPWADRPNGERESIQNCYYIRTAVLQVLDWVKAEQLGPFRPTGSGQSYAAFRRRFLDTQLLVHDDIPRLHAERAAMWTGRCEAWQHGQLQDGPFVEHDMHSAYSTIARDCDVPTIAKRAWDHPTVDHVKELMLAYSVLAQVTVKTDVPCLPARLAGRTLWPVGEFTTWIWDPELTLAFTHCQEVKIHKVYTYLRGPALRNFAAFVLDGIAERESPYSLVPRRIMKHWSRCLVGRLGLRYRSWQKFGTQEEADLRLITYLDTEEGTSTDMLIAGHDRLILADMAESVDSLPQIPSWVMSECRRRLWRLMSAAGDDLIYVDTDSIVTRDESEGQFRMMGVAYDGRWPIVRKGNYRKLTIHGPRNLATEFDRRVAGLPLTARQVAPLEFSGQVMRSIKESMRAGQLDCVANIPRHFVLDSPDMRRQHLPNNQTAPFTVSLPKGEECSDE